MEIYYQTNVALIKNEKITDNGTLYRCILHGMILT